MELNKQAIEKVLSSKRLLNLVLSKEPLSEKMWGLDELTTAQVLHVQEVYKRNASLVEPYLPTNNEKLEESSERISLLEGIFDDKIVFIPNLPFDTGELTLIEFVEKFKVFISTIDSDDEVKTGMKVQKQKSKEILFEIKLNLLKKGSYDYRVSLNGTSTCSHPNDPNDAIKQFVHLFDSKLFSFSENLIKDYLIRLLTEDKYNELINLIGGLNKSIYRGDVAFLEDGLNLIKSQLNQISNPTCKEVMDSKIKHFDKSLELLRLLYDPKISLLEKLLKNDLAQRSEFWIVPGAPKKRCIILFHGDFYDQDFLDVADLYSGNGLSGSVLIKATPSNPLVMYLIKDKKISAYIQDTGLHHSSIAYENLRGSNLSDEDVSYVLSLPHNNMGDDAKFTYNTKKFMNELKQIEDFLF